jgi:hypothetical protein
LIKTINDTNNVIISKPIHNFNFFLFPKQRYNNYCEC